MSESTNNYTTFSFSGVDFNDPESVKAYYGGGGGLWRREEVTILSSYYSPDIFHHRGVEGKKPEIGLVLEWFFHSQERQVEIANADLDKRQWMSSARFGAGKFAAEKGVEVVRADGTVVRVDDEDQKGESLRWPNTLREPLWDKGGLMLFHKALPDVVAPKELQDKWAACLSGAASPFTGLHCNVARIDVEMDAEQMAKGLANLQARLRADRASAEDIASAKYYPPTYIVIDEILGWEDVDSLRAYDPNAPVITDAAVAYIKAQVGAKVTNPQNISKNCLNEVPNLHGEVYVALQDISALAPYEIYWKNGALSLEA